MGLGGINIWQLLIVLAIVVMVFGTSRLRSLGGDLGSAIKGFKNAMQEPEAAESPHKEMAESVEPAAISPTSDERSTA